MILGAVTTIEYREKSESKDEDVRRKFEIAHIKYDMNDGYLNMKHFLGVPYLWWLPVDGKEDPLDDGTYRWGPHNPRGLSTNEYYY
jgi:hypothetical protein